MNHQIKKEDIYEDDLISSVTFAKSVGDGSDKKLELQTNVVNLMSHFSVTIHGNQEYYGSDIDKAIEAYNKG